MKTKQNEFWAGAVRAVVMAMITAIASIAPAGCNMGTGGGGDGGGGGGGGTPTVPSTPTTPEEPTYDYNACADALCEQRAEDELGRVQALATQICADDVRCNGDLPIAHRNVASDTFNSFLLASFNNRDDKKYHVYIDPVHAHFTTTNINAEKLYPCYSSDDISRASGAALSRVYDLHNALPRP
jgi:hypothetical protein